MSGNQAVRIQRLELEQFRIHREFVVEIPPAGVRISGPNGSGKSTILEAIQLLSTTRPRRGATDADLIHHESGRELGVPPYARVVGEFDRAGVHARVEAYIEKSERRGTAKKTLRIGERNRRAGDVVGVIPTVTFAPDDLDLVLGSPALRRRFLDILLSQVDRQYLRCLGRYARILSQRNGLLRQLAESESAAPVADQFAFWDEQLVALGAYLVAARARAIGILRERSRIWFEHLAAEAGTLQLAYLSSIEASTVWWETVIRDSRDALDAAQRVGQVFERQLRRTRDAEIARGMTLTGPHRDDLVLTLDDHDLARFGSRGQQRLAVVAIKLAEIDVVGGSAGLRPIFLLDDVLSELDADHRVALLRAVAGSAGQLIVTSTDPSLLAVESLDELGSVALKR